MLVAEDDARQAELIRRYLVREEHTVLTVADGRAAGDEVRPRRLDLLILDVMPAMDGLDVVRALRRDYDVPVLMVTARSTAEDKLIGFDLGADDSLAKPYDPRELMARVRSLLRRSRTADGARTEPLRVGLLELDRVWHEVKAEGRRIACTSAEFRILEAAAGQPGAGVQSRPAAGAGAELRELHDDLLAVLHRYMERSRTPSPGAHPVRSITREKQDAADCRAYL
ncbi:response regulator transcription factor [Streptomyces sp. YC419]|uniref:Response regulator transcription factor n=1 Tax=Streptomyces ureilyticus TaxID=1775131 RepID=A0ABX0DNA4_9ACTN|nr:response regulator transcription factor [Streptomyces ureilyticus]